jgi:peptidoglycan/LPS O-acetylase OafA/YrhL
MNKITHQFELDILRIIGAINIVLYHYTFRGYAADNMTTLYFPLLGSIFKYGFFGLYLFFILSGYTIAQSAANKKITSYISARLLRLYPSFWVAVCLTTTATLCWGGERYKILPKQFFLNLTMLSGYIGIKSVDEAYWFMFVILKFYFLVAILIFLRIFKFQNNIAGIWLFLAIASSYYHIPKIDFFLIPQYAPFLISGMIFYSARNDGWNFFRSFLSIVSLIFSVYLLKQIVTGFHIYYKTELSFFVVFILIVFVNIFMFFISINKKQIKLSEIFITLGACTYPLYLIHQNIGYMIFNNFGHMTNRFIILLLTLSLMISIAIAISKYADPFIRRIINKVIQFIRRIIDKIIKYFPFQPMHLS